MAAQRYGSARRLLQAAVYSTLSADNSGMRRQALWSPKLSVIAGPFAGLPRTEFFFDAGRCFRSNDARGATTTVDPRSGDAVAPVRPLSATRGVEIGVRSEAISGLQTSLALWRLDATTAGRRAEGCRWTPTWPGAMPASPTGAEFQALSTASRRWRPR